VCGLAADSESVHQVDNRLPAMRLGSLGYPYPSLHVLILVSEGQRCMQLLSVALTLDVPGGLDWIGLDWALPRLCAPQGLKVSTPWRTCYRVAKSKQGITARSS